MKLLLFGIFSLSLLSFSAKAYIEENTVGEAQATAGEQNSNLYRLNAATAVRLKKLQKIDEVLANNPKALLTSGGDIEALLSNKKQVDLDSEKELSDLYKQTIERTAKKTSLIVSSLESARQIQQLSATAVKDAQAVASLRQKIRRAR